jgi:hypothetical protein
MNGTDSSSLVSSQGTSYVLPEKKTCPSPGTLGWPSHPNPLPRMNSEIHATQPGWGIAVSRRIVMGYSCRPSGSLWFGIVGTLKNWNSSLQKSNVTLIRICVLNKIVVQITTVI